MTANHQMVSKTTLESYEQSDPPALYASHQSMLSTPIALVEITECPILSR